jgi:hypothetical protein
MMSLPKGMSVNKQVAANAPAEEIIRDQKISIKLHYSA